jgi:two-component system sensor kinase
MENKINKFIVKNITEIIVVFDDCGIISSANDYAINEYGESMIGKNIFNIIDIPKYKKYDDYENTHTFKNSLKEHFHIETKVFSILNDDNKLKYNIIIAKDIEKEEEYQNQLKELILQKESYIMDVHHKIKNNLQTIISILDMWLKSAKDNNEIGEPCMNTFETFVMDIQRRIIAISLVHSMLNKSNYDSHTLNINFSVYIYNLLEQISAFFSMENKIIKFEFNGKDYLINSDRAIPGGLIINDIISNFYKFCFNSKDVTNSSIKIKMNINKKMTSVKLIIEMFYISKDKYKLPRESENLIAGLLNQIQATMTINYTKNKSVFTIIF